MMLAREPQNNFLNNLMVVALVGRHGNYNCTLNWTHEIYHEFTIILITNFKRT